MEFGWNSTQWSQSSSNFLPPLVIRYVDGQRHGPFLNGFTSEYEFADTVNSKITKHGFWEKKCNFSGGGTFMRPR